MDRIENPELAKSYRKIGCQLCGLPKSEGHHIKSKGSWGPDIEINLIALCRTHHQTIHQYGINKMILHFPNLEPILISKGWYRQKIGAFPCEIVKWFNDDVII